MIRQAGALLAILIIGSPLLAQTAADDGPRPQRWRGGGGGNWMGRMFDRVADDLSLDEAQREKFAEITAGQRERMQEMGARWREARQAEEEGDTERAAQLRSELRDAGGPGEGMRQMFEQLEPILRDDQLDQLAEMRDRWQRGEQMRETGRRLRDEIPDELELNDEQRARYDDLLDDYRAGMRERWSGMRPLFEQMREAGEAGDEERLAELRAEMEAARPDEQAALAELLDRIEPILRDDQKATFAELRGQFAGGGESAERLTGNVRDVLRAAKRVNLNRAQRDKIRRIERDAVRAQRTLSRRDKEGEALLAADVRKQVEGLLDEVQRAQFTRYLDRSERPSRR